MKNYLNFSSTPFFPKRFGKPIVEKIQVQVFAGLIGYANFFLRGNKFVNLDKKSSKNRQK